MVRIQSYDLICVTKSECQEAVVRHSKSQSMHVHESAAGVANQMKGHTEPVVLSEIRLL